MDRFRALYRALFRCCCKTEDEMSVEETSIEMKDVVVDCPRYPRTIYVYGYDPEQIQRELQMPKRVNFADRSTLLPPLKMRTSVNAAKVEMSSSESEEESSGEAVADK